MKKNNDKLSLKKDTLKGLNGAIRTGIKTGLASQQCHPQSGISRCVICPI